MQRCKNYERELQQTIKMLFLLSYANADSEYSENIIQDKTPIIFFLPLKMIPLSFHLVTQTL